nr:MAG TPA: hypothetical protein [Inoviridae sp.]
MNGIGNYCFTFKKQFIKYWDEFTYLGKFILVLTAVPIVILDCIDYLMNKSITVCDKADKWFAIRKDKYEHRNPNKS